MLDDAKARLTTLDAQIMLTQRTIKAQEYNAQSVAAAVERARALVKQTTSTRIRLEPLVPQGFASQEDLDQARTAEKAARAELEATLLQAKTGLGGRDRRGCHGGATRRGPGANRPR
ncbi:tripartite multidrug resistance system inner membrane protein [Klebsiella pneumoniae subsp. rhinoscleromatis]|nr:tripartite multidrug resistance system inner membrane protein [Klebsiella pneumoniae subsp. rhinoscleromatis]